MNEETLRQKLDEIEKLPSLPVVVNQINQLIASNRSSMMQISTVIARDQAIASRVIRLVNSAFYGLQGRVASIQQAITLLGLNTVKNIVMGVAIVNSFGEAKTSSTFDRQKFWLHTFSCALLSRGIAQIRKSTEPEVYFMAGLLHDIGILIIDQFFHDEFIKIYQECTTKGVNYVNAEKEVLGTTHCMVGEYLAEKWHLPDNFIVGILHHHNPLCALNETAANLDIILTVHVADAFTQNNGFHVGFEGAPSQVSRIALHRLGISESEIAPIWEETARTTNTVMREWGV